MEKVRAGRYQRNQDDAAASQIRSGFIVCHERNPQRSRAGLRGTFGDGRAGIDPGWLSPVAELLMFSSIQVEKQIL
jgi:hypothetical protein